MATSSLPITRFSGLYTSVNPVAGLIPEGAMEVADNLVIRSTDILEPRRGYYASSPTIPVGGGGGGGPPLTTCDPATKPSLPGFSYDPYTGLPGGVVYCADGVTPVFMGSAIGSIVVGPATYVATPLGTWFVLVFGTAGAIAVYDPSGANPAATINDGINPGNWQFVCGGGTIPMPDAQYGWICGIPG